MDKRSAAILLKGKGEIRAIGEPCDPSCFMWFCCSNSVPDGFCKGFSLLDGESRKLLRRNLQEDDLLYLEDCVGAVQNGCRSDVKRSLTSEVYRCLKPISDILREEEPIERLGFRGMLDSAFPTAPESTPKAVIRGFGRGFVGMLDELNRDKPEIRSFVEPARKNSENPTTTIHHVFGFLDMLDDCNRKYEEEAEKAKAVIRNVGFRGVLDSISEHEEVTPEPILRDLQRRLRDILNTT